MFDVRVGDVTYNMMFQRSTGKRGKKLTTCVISKVVDIKKHGPERYKRIVESTVKLHSGEQDRKVIGFKWALRQAFKDVKELRPMLFKKGERFLFWNKFLDIWGKSLGVSDLDCLQE